MSNTNWLVELFSIFGNFGTLLMGIAALRGVNQWINERKKTRSEAASSILARVRAFQDELIFITDYRTITQYPGYIESHKYSSKESDVSIFGRVIGKKIHDLRIKLHKFASKLTLDENTKLFEILNELAKFSKQLSIAISESLKDIKRFHQEFKDLDELLGNYKEKLNSLILKIEEMLIPIID